MEENKTSAEIAEELRKDGGEVVEINPREVMDQYFQDPSIIEKLDNLAIGFNTVSRGKWTTATELIKKSTIKNKVEMSHLLDLLILSKRALSKKVGDDVIMYKMTLNNDQRKKGLKIIISELENQLQLLKTEYDSIK